MNSLEPMLQNFNDFREECVDIMCELRTITEGIVQYEVIIINENNIGSIFRQTNGARFCENARVQRDDCMFLDWQTMRTSVITDCQIN